MIEMTLHRVGLSTEDGSPELLLRETCGDRVLRLSVSTAHANALIRHLHRTPPYRPQTHEVLLAAVTALGASFAAAYLDGIARDGEINAHIIITHRARRIPLNAAAADAVVIAVRANSPIYVNPALIAKLASDHRPAARKDSPDLSAANPPAITLEDGDVFREFIDNLPSLDDLGK